MYVGLLKKFPWEFCCSEPHYVQVWPTDVGNHPTAQFQLMTAESPKNVWSITWKFTSRILSYFFYNWTSREKSTGDKNYDQ